MGMKYVGSGFVPGIPARDLDDDEVERHGGAEALEATGLYRHEVKAYRPRRENKALVPVEEDKAEAQPEPEEEKPDTPA